MGNRHTDTHTDTQTKYSNPRCTCAPRVNYRHKLPEPKALLLTSILATANTEITTVHIGGGDDNWKVVIRRHEGLDSL